MTSLYRDDSTQDGASSATKQAASPLAAQKRPTDQADIPEMKTSQESSSQRPGGAHDASSAGSAASVAASVSAVTSASVTGLSSVATSDAGSISSAPVDANRSDRHDAGRIGAKTPNDPKVPGSDGPLGLSHGVWALIGVVGLLFAAIFWANLWRLWLKTNLIDGTAEWAHATLVPIIGLYYVYLHLDEIKAQPIKPLLGFSSNRPRWFGAIGTILVGLFAWQVVPQLGPLGESFGSEFVVMGVGLIGLGVLALVLDWGLATLLGGLLLSAYGIWPGQNDYVKDVGMVVALFGAVLTMCGWGVMRIVYFPILFLICALPWPGLFYSKLALPLQELASLIGVGVINVLGVDAMKEGTTIWISFPPGSGKDPMPIGVAEACAGLKSLMTFITMGAAIAYLSNRTLWQKLLIVASAIPIAIGCNIFRVAMMGYFTGIGRPEVLSGFTHGIAGLVFLMVPGMALLLGMVWVLDKLVIEEADEEPLVLKKGQS